MPLTPDVYLPIAFVFLFAVLFVYTQLVGPRLRKRRFSGALLRGGWIAVVPDREPSWREIVNLAIEENRGAAAEREYDEKVGPLAMHTTISEARSGKTHELYRDPGTMLHRYVGIGTRIKDVDTRSTPLPWLGRTKRRYVGREVWIGEARRIPVERPEMVFSAFAAMFGSAARTMAATRGIDPETVPSLASPSDNTPVQAVREVLEETGTATDVMARVYLAPRSWAMILPFDRMGSRFEEILELVKKISTALDRVSR